MKKIITVLLLVTMVLGLAGCGEKKPEEVTYKLGMGVSTSLNSTTDGLAQVDAVVAAVVWTADGKIVDVAIDAAQNKVTLTDGTFDAELTFKSKMELGDDYNMKKYAADCEKEWYEQVHNFEKYCIGKTADEIANIALRTRGEDEPHPGYIVVADEELFAQCSIQIGEFQKAIAKAMSDEFAVEFTTADTFKLGVAVNSTIDSGSKVATAEEDGEVDIYSDFAAAVVGTDGKVLAALTDAIQPKIGFDATGAITKTTFVATKRELKEDYNMKKYAADCNHEWYEQAASFTKYCVGKTADEIANLATRTRGEDEPHPGYVVTADETLFAECSISIPGLKAVVAKAANNAD